jgi:hypothetical protein
LFRWCDRFASGVDVKEYDSFRITCDQNESIKMLVNIGDVMIIGTDNSLAAWNGTNLQNYDMGIGCVSENGYVKHGYLFFIHYTGIYRTSGESPQLISDKIKPYIDGATKSGLESACMGKKGDSIFCYIGDVTLYNEDGSIDKTLSNVTLEYNLRQGNWFVHTGIEIKQFCTYPQETDSTSLQIIDNSDRNIYEFLSGETDNGTVIPFRMDTEEINFGGEIESLFSLRKIILEVERGTNIHIFLSLDGGAWYELKTTATKGANTIAITAKDDNNSAPPRCRRVRISMRHNEKQLCKISRLALEYSSSIEEEENRA